MRIPTKEELDRDPIDSLTQAQREEIVDILLRIRAEFEAWKAEREAVAVVADVRQKEAVAA